MDVSSPPVGTEEKGKATHHMGRPKLVLEELPIDPYALAEQLAALMCSHEEIAVGLGISLTTLKRRLGVRNDIQGVCDARLQEAIRSGKERGKTELRRILRAQAKRGNTHAGIFLAKNELGYSDRQRVQHEGDTGGVTVVNELGPTVTAKPRNKNWVDIPRAQGDASGNGVEQ